MIERTKRCDQCHTVIAREFGAYELAVVRHETDRVLHVCSAECLEKFAANESATARHLAASSASAVPSHTEGT